MEAESSIGACIIRKALTEGPMPLLINTMAISDNGFRLRISSILPDLIVTYNSKTTFFALTTSRDEAQVIKALERSDQVLSQFKSCTVILPSSNSSLASDHIANHEHQDISYMFSDDDPILLAIEIVKSCHPDVLESLTGEIASAWSEQCISWDAFELAVSALRLDLGSDSSAASLSFYESLRGISSATSEPNAISVFMDLTGIN